MQVDWVLDVDTAGHHRTRGWEGNITRISRLSGTLDFYNLGGPVEGNWLSAVALTRHLQIEGGIQELLVRYGAVSLDSPSLSIAVMVSLSNCAEFEITWRVYNVDWATLAASNGGSALLTLSTGEKQLLQLKPKAPLMVPAGWAQDVIYAYTHGITHAFRRAGDGELVGVQYDGHQVTNWLPK